MAHYALINSNNIVVQVITGVDENVIQIDANGTAIGGSSENWEAFYASRPWFFGLTCKRTSYNAREGKGFRKNYAGIGFFYDADQDAFIPPKPFASWLLNEEIYEWEAPTPMPTDGKVYRWDEDTTSWVEVPTL